MKKLQNILELPWVDTFSQTLIHSLWQGLLCGSIYLLACLLIEKNYVKVKVGLSLMLLQIMLSVGTFIYFSKTTPISTNYENLSLIANYLNKGFDKTPNIDWFNLVKAGLVLVWIVGAVFFFLRNLYSAFYIFKLKNENHNESSNKLNLVLLKIKDKIQVPNLEIRESIKIHTALVIGHFKPLLLMPAAYVNQLSSEQLELVIAHEIAHIKRHDFLWNWFLVIIENIFFFNPFIFLMSKSIKQYREWAADDWAAENFGNKEKLAYTLAQIQVSVPKYKLAMAFEGKTPNTLRRIQRLMGIKQNMKVSLSPKLLLLFLAVPLLYFGFSSKGQNVSKKPIQKIDTLDTKSVIIAAAPCSSQLNISEKGIKVNGKDFDLDDNQKIILKENLDKINELNKKIDAESIELDKYSEKYDSESDRIYQSFNASSKDLEIDHKEMEKVSKEFEKHSKEFEKKIAKLKPNDKDFETLMSNYEKEFGQKSEAFDNSMRKLEKLMDEKNKAFEEKQKSFDENITKLESEFNKSINLKEKNIALMMQEIEAYNEKIIELLPKEIQAQLKDDQDLPKPPPPPGPPPGPKSPKVKALSPPPPPPGPNRPKLKAPAPPTPPRPGPKKSNLRVLSPLEPPRI